MLPTLGEDNSILQPKKSLFHHLYCFQSFPQGAWGGEEGGGDDGFGFLQGGRTDGSPEEADDDREGDDDGEADDDVQAEADDDEQAEADDDEAPEGDGAEETATTRNDKATSPGKDVVFVPNFVSLQMRLCINNNFKSFPDYFKTHVLTISDQTFQSAIFDILEPPAFKRYGICWIF